MSQTSALPFDHHRATRFTCSTSSCSQIYTVPFRPTFIIRIHHKRLFIERLYRKHSLLCGRGLSVCMFSLVMPASCHSPTHAVSGVLTGDSKLCVCVYVVLQALWPCCFVASRRLTTPTTTSLKSPQSARSRYVNM